MELAIKIRERLEKYRSSPRSIQGCTMRSTNVAKIRRSPSFTSSSSQRRAAFKEHSPSNAQLVLFQHSKYTRRRRTSSPLGGKRNHLLQPPRSNRSPRRSRARPPVVFHSLQPRNLLRNQPARRGANLHL
jgi:hypothetical protein